MAIALTIDAYQEQYDFGRFGNGWHDPRPPWRDEIKPDTHAYTPAHTVFAFGLVLFALMTLDYDNAKVYEDLGQADRMEDMVKSAHYCWFDHKDLMKNFFDRPTHYSLLLRTVVTDCLNLNPAQRPEITEIYDAAIDQCNLLAADQDKPEYAADPAFATLRFGKADRGNFFPATLTDDA